MAVSFVSFSSVVFGSIMFKLAEVLEMELICNRSGDLGEIIIPGLSEESGNTFFVENV
jgi:hypothetical protein